MVDGVVGDYLCERFGDLQSNPLTIEVENNRIRALHSENKDLRDEFQAYTNTDENSDRVGEFAIGHEPLSLVEKHLRGSLVPGRVGVGGGGMWPVSQPTTPGAVATSFVFARSQRSVQPFTSRSS